MWTTGAVKLETPPAVVPLDAASSGWPPGVGAPLRLSSLRAPGPRSAATRGGKVLVPEDEQIKRLNAARFQLDIMRVPGIIVARTDAEAVAEVIECRSARGESVAMTADEWRAFAGTASLYRAKEKAGALDIDIDWDCELPRTPEGYYQVRGGIPYAVAKSLAAAPFADLLWMETKTAKLDDAREFAEAIHAVYPDKMLAYNLSPRSTGTRPACLMTRCGSFRKSSPSWDRVQLHHLRRSPDRRHGSRGVWQGTEGGRHAGAGTDPAQDPARRLTVPNAADARRRSTARCSARGILGADRTAAIVPLTERAAKHQEDTDDDETVDAPRRGAHNRAVALGRLRSDGRVPLAHGRFWAAYLNAARAEERPPLSEPC